MWNSQDFFAKNIVNPSLKVCQYNKKNILPKSKKLFRSRVNVLELFNIHSPYFPKFIVGNFRLGWGGAQLLEPLKQAFHYTN